MFMVCLLELGDLGELLVIWLDVFTGCLFGWFYWLFV